MNAPYEGQYYRGEVMIVSDTQISLRKAEQIVVKNQQQMSKDIKVEKSFFLSDSSFLSDPFFFQ